MIIKLNGETREIPGGTKVANLVQELGLEGKRIAVEINETLVPRTQHATHQLQENDEMEIVQAIGGG
ncbi:sulfur carrier protein ThiS [Solemya elarraichensis gill symbiont]|uniref:Thiamine biosynthesis protein ThiS n=1 Tax=Solemya elarraichensis gill symbiont TaxID=1918949 RepID=A0A1T2L200_9GAMM|nr:sulfur carrier protein ThiS [Solemya elarraichensis gill symbiont]OOZ38976.1 thiamine biosynthesis protein ThiS [Solemya elarraichensis gill symbiont]